jgi:hypothetical protein
MFYREYNTDVQNITAIVASESVAGELEIVSDSLNDVTLPGRFARTTLTPQQYMVVMIDLVPCIRMVIATDEQVHALLESSDLEQSIDELIDGFDASNPASFVV